MANWLETLQDRNEAGHLSGTSQAKRGLAALDPQYMGIDESDRYSYVAFLLKYAELIAFYDTENHLTGSWSELLSRSAILSLISLESFDAGAVSEQFHTGIERMKADALQDKPIHLLESEPCMVVAAIFEGVEHLKLSSRRLEQFNRELITLIQQNLAPIFKDYMEFLGRLKAKRAAAPELDTLLADLVDDWVVEDAAPAAKEEQTTSTDLEDLQALTAIFMELMQVIALVRTSTSQYIQKDLEGGRVNPHIALLLGFFEMMKVAYAELNQVTARHLNYYYLEVLKLKLKPEQCDQAHVVFTLAENVHSYALEAGTALVGGPDSEGNPRIYRLDRGISLNKAKLGALKVILHDERLPETPLLQAPGVPVDTYFIPTRPLQQLDKDILQSTAQGERFFRPGFAIGSALWHVDPTTAMLKLSLHCDPLTYERFSKQLGMEWNAHMRLPLKDPVGIAPKNQLIRNFFSVEYSIDGGQWFQVPAEQTELSLREPTVDHTNPVLDLNLLLQPGDPAIAPCQQPAFPEAVAQGVPVFRFLVAEDRLHFYQLFSGLVIHAVELEANVLDVRNLILQNDYGLLDPNVPFLPFGPMPSLGSNFYIGHQRLLNYPLNALKINIEWYGLPTEKLGFAGHYADYGFEGDNHSFKALLSILDKKVWFPKQQKQLLSLFQSVSPEDDSRPVPKDRLSKIRRINEVDMSLVQLPKSAPSGPLMAYDKETLRGFLRLQLAEPIMAFGHQLYPEILTRQIGEATRKKKPLPTPNQPYTPTIKHISLDYSSSTRFSLKRGQEPHRELLYHIHPFGVVKANDPVNQHPLPLLPRYALGGHLYLGIEGLGVGQPLSILFQISDDGALDYETPPELTWHYLSGGEWIPLRVEERLFDTTLGLTRSGVMGFRLESPIDPNHQLLPPALTWLSCASSIGTAFLSNMMDIRLQATICTFENQDNRLEHLENGLPAQSINALAVPDSSIAAVEQPYASYGGRPAENMQGYYKRVSELLRHKDRAVSIWDYESLVLEQFPEIRKAICQSHLDEQGQPAMGHLLLTVIPRMKQSDRERSRVTRVSAGRIQEIQQYIQQRCSPFVQVKVTNAVVEHVMVSGGIRLKAGYDDYHFYLNKLNQGLRKMLSPWYYHDDLSAGVAVKLYASSVIEFIDHQPYVDFVSNFKLFHMVNGVIVNARTEMSEYEVIQPLRPNSILLSVEKHALVHLSESHQQESGIGNMITQVNLTVPHLTPATQGIDTTIVQKNLTLPGDEAGKKRSFTIKINTAAT